MHGAARSGCIDPLDRVRVQRAPHADDDDVTEPFAEHGRRGSRYLERFGRCRDSLRRRRQRPELIDQQREQDQEAHHEHSALDDVRPGDGADAAEGTVDHHDQRQPHDAVVVRLIAVGAREPL